MTGQGLASDTQLLSPGIRTLPPIKRYDAHMGKRTSLIVDTALMEEAAAMLGTKGPTATVRAALERAVRQERLDRLAQLELPEDFMDQLKRMREPRKFEFD
jgi:Arc/MetJ family transcription regulator